MKTRSLLLGLVVMLQAAWILGTTFQQERSLAQGRIVTLETAPVDPRDLLRGDFVILNYKISSLPLDLFSPRVNSLPPGTDVYVTLAPEGDFHVAVAASTSWPVVSDGQVVLKGKAEHGWWSSDARSQVRVVYGLERYYVREGTGNPRGKLTARVAVPSSGQGILKEVLVEGVPYAEALRRQAGE
jgi:uncharacterized membrane-anchored protein